MGKQHEFRGRRALITGASSGIGLVTARRLARGGAAVVMLAEVEAVRAAAAEVDQSETGNATPWIADLSQPAEVAGLYERIEEEVGPVDIVINNAGIGLQATVLQTEPADLRAIFEVNFFAVATLCRDVLRRMAARGHGHILNVSSAAARRGLPRMSAYAASKHALHGFTQSLRQEARPLGVLVSEVLPISVRTPFFASAQNRTGVPYRPRGWVQTPEHVADLIVCCLRRPRPEIHTSRLTHLGFVFDTAFPNFADWLMARHYARRARND